METKKVLDAQQAVNEKVDYNIKMLKANIESLEANRAIYATALDIVKDSPLFKRFMILDSYEKCILFDLVVDSFTEVMPLLEEIEAKLGVEFTSSRDIASSGYRTLSTGCGRIRIDLTPKEDGAGCRRVLKGYEQVEVFEFQCEGE